MIHRTLICLAAALALAAPALADTPPTTKPTTKTVSVSVGQALDYLIVIACHKGKSLTFAFEGTKGLFITLYEGDMGAVNIGRTATLTHLNGCTGTLEIEEPQPLFGQTPTLHEVGVSLFCNIKRARSRAPFA